MDRGENVILLPSIGLGMLCGSVAVAGFVLSVLYRFMDVVGLRIS